MTAPGERWRPTPALLAGAVVVVGCLLLAVLLRRPDLVVIGAPFLIGALVALVSAPPDDVTVRVELQAPSGAVWEDERFELTARIEVDANIDVALVGVVTNDGLAPDRSDVLRCVRPVAGVPLLLPIRAEAVRWGRWTAGPVSISLGAAHGLLRRTCAARGAALVSVVPIRGSFEATDALPHAAGMVGGHRSPRPGDGSDLLALRPFVPGDRLRRITWPASLRTGRLHVLATTDDRDADIELVLDTWSELGVAGTPAGTSLDASVRAAASIAEHYLSRGDRVGLIDLGRPARPIRLAAGRRHLQVILDALLSVRVRTPDAGVTTRALGRVGPRALVVVLSTLLSEPIGGHVAALAQAGRAVLVVDTLPADVVVPPTGAWTPLAWRLALLRRDTLVESLSERGVPVARWQGAGSLDAVLRRLSVATRAARRSR